MSESGSSRNRLGRGLSALLGDEAEDYAELDRAQSVKTVPIEQLVPGQFQPRHRFDDEGMNSLVASVREKGILQPILVRRDPLHAQQYEIIAGERRWRAAQKAQLHEVPIVVREMTNQETLEVALIENLQREDLSPIEEAAAFQRLMDEFSHTQEALAKALGKSRSHIANTLRLLTLPDSVKELIRDGKLSAGHARALVGVEAGEQIARKIVQDGLTVRQTEALLQKQKGAPPRKKKAAAPVEKDSDTRALEEDLSNLLGLSVSIRIAGGSNGQAGALTINYKTLDQLDDILQRLNKGGQVAGVTPAEAETTEGETGDPS